MILPFCLANGCADWHIYEVWTIWYEPWHEISNNVVYATNKDSDQPAHTCSLIRAFASHLNILWVLSYWLSIIWSFYEEFLKGGCTGSSESRLVKMPHCRKSHVTARHGFSAKSMLQWLEKSIYVSISYFLQYSCTKLMICYLYC